MNNFLSLLNNSDFIIENNEITYLKNKVIEKIDNLYHKLLKIYSEWKNKLVYIDIRDRFLFFILFFTLIKLNSKVVFVPNEIKEVDYLNNEDIFITDNKDNKEFIIIDSDFNIKNIPSLNNKKEYINYNDFFLYTSGSTRKPRLISKNFNNIYIELKELKKILNIEKGSIFYFTPPLYHIYGFLFGMALPLYSNSVIIMTQNFTPESIVEFLERQKIDFFISIPHYYEMFEKLNKVDSFRNIKNLISSSAPLLVELSKIYYNKNIKITEIYGSTETGGIAYRTSAISLEWKLFSYVKTIKKQHNEEKENELFIDSEAISVFYDKELGYNTGDMVEFRENNSFILLGRNTRFVKISGKRVDLNFIQNKIIDLLNKEFNITITNEQIYIFEKEKILIMIYDIEKNLDLEKFKKILKGKLPGYSVPRIFINHKIPKNSMNKIDKDSIDKIYHKFIAEK